MNELLDLKDLKKNSDEYEAFKYFNKVIRNKYEPDAESRARIDEAVRIARKHNYCYLNEDGDFSVDCDGNPVYKEISMNDSMRYALGLIKLTDKEKAKFRIDFYGA
ncbi:hypothetical protein [Pseudomonas syringae]|uniref:hypothetical protein n=1 Tax=Pseudomonas syringae TaxID=317 RepID=UPI00128F98F5|nr:hypothetical protein [Pseudomonas syringae]